MTLLTLVNKCNVQTPHCSITWIGTVCVGNRTGNVWLIRSHTLICLCQTFYFKQNYTQMSVFVFFVPSDRRDAQILRPKLKVVAEY